MSTFKALRILHNLIGEALADIERVFTDYEPSTYGSSNSSYRSSSPPSSPITVAAQPLDFPSLDDRYDSFSPAEALLSHPSVVHATKLLVASTGQLSAMVQRPFLTICDASMGVRMIVVPVLFSLNISISIPAVPPSILHAFSRGFTCGGAS